MWGYIRGILSREVEDEVIACGDISGAFLAADEYPEGDEPRYVLFQEYKGGPCMYGN